jgi:hypothetical protein
VKRGAELPPTLRERVVINAAATPGGLDGGAETTPQNGDSLEKAAPRAVETSVSHASPRPVDRPEG